MGIPNLIYSDHLSHWAKIFTVLVHHGISHRLSQSFCNICVTATDLQRSTPVVSCRFTCNYFTPRLANVGFSERTTISKG